ncbi:MAG: hypothetical protein ACK5Y2_02710 [Bdellovibrionales bacterium]
MQILLLFPFFWGVLAQAEYRVFKLVIRKPAATASQPATERTVLSTLDPLQYKDYEIVQPDETVTSTETWMCRGRTDGQTDFCPNPNKAQIPDSTVSNQNAP